MRRASFVAFGRTTIDAQHAVLQHCVLNQHSVGQQKAGAGTAAPRCRGADTRGCHRRSGGPGPATGCLPAITSRSVAAKPATAIEIRNRSSPSACERPLDIVGRVAISGFGEAIDALFERVEAEQKRRRKHRDTGHPIRPCISNVTRRPEFQWHRPMPVIWDDAGRASRPQRQVGEQLDRQNCSGGDPCL